MSFQTKPIVLNGEEIEKILPHREDWLLVDKVVTLSDERIVAETIFSEKGCQGHFPNHLVIPGSRLTEAMSQVVAILASQIVFPDEVSSLEFRLSGYDGIRFRGEVHPGEKVIISAEPQKIRMLKGNKGFDGKFWVERQFFSPRSYPDYFILAIYKEKRRKKKKALAFILCCSYLDYFVLFPLSFKLLPF